MKDTGMGVKAIVIHQGHVLFLIKPNGGLDLPGGRVEPGETPRQAVRREIEEETGLEARILAATGACHHVTSKNRVVQIYGFVCESTGGQFRLSHEHVGHVWLSLEELGGVIRPQDILAACINTRQVA